MIWYYQSRGVFPSENGGWHKAGTIQAWEANETSYPVDSLVIIDPDRQPELAKLIMEKGNAYPNKRAA